MSGSSNYEKKFPVWPILGEAIRIPWRHRCHFGRLLVIPVIIIAIYFIADTDAGWVSHGESRHLASPS